MGSVIGILPSLSTANPLPATPGSSPVSTSSFAQELASAIEQVLGSTKLGSQIEIDVSPASSQTSGAGSQTSDGQQFTVIVKNIAGPISPLEYAAGLAGNWAPSSTPSAGIPANDATAVAAASPTTSGSGKTKMTEADAYWAEQPPAVQALRNLPDLESRTALATTLRAKGYTLDYPIMVQGWDPLKTMQARQFYGYTWVPSYLQTPIQEAPGCTVLGLQPYDPNSPPPGSIKVTTDFAVGTLDGLPVTS
jgi:hypothetical protein